MAINVSHSPIAAGMKLAEQAGTVEDWRYRQGMTENRRAFDIQTGLQYDKMRQDFMFGAENVAANRTANKIQQMQFMADQAERQRQFDIQTQLQRDEMQNMNQYRQGGLDLQKQQLDFAQSPQNPQNVRAQAYDQYQQYRSQPQFYGSDEQKMLDARVRAMENAYGLAKSRYEETLTDYGQPKPGQADMSRERRRQMDEMANAYQALLSQQAQMYAGPQQQPGQQIMIGGQAAGATPGAAPGTNQQGVYDDAGIDAALDRRFGPQAMP